MRPLQPCFSGREVCSTISSDTNARIADIPNKNVVQRKELQLLQQLLGVQLDDYI